jgi:hypothetical protein
MPRFVMKRGIFDSNLQPLFILSSLSINIKVKKMYLCILE